MDEKIINKLKERYASVHPLIFQRSVERSKTETELFDILDTIPKGFPIVWSEEDSKWIRFKNI